MNTSQLTFPENVTKDQVLNIYDLIHKIKYVDVKESIIIAKRKKDGVICIPFVNSLQEYIDLVSQETYRIVEKIGTIEYRFSDDFKKLMNEWEFIK